MKKRIRTVRFWVRVQVVLQIVLIGVVGWLAWSAFQTHEALCSFRDAVQADYDRGTAYVEAVKMGKRDIIVGVTLPELEDTLAAQRSRLAALGDLGC